MASLTPPEGTSVNLPLDAYKASALPEGINLMQLTINGPRSTTLRDIEIAIAEGKHLCFHLLKEEYDHLPKSIMQPDGEGVIISEANQVSLIRNLEGDLRKPWLHLSGHQHIMDSVGQTSWLLSEGRLVSAHLEESYIVIVEPCIFGNFHDLCELKGITFFNRHHGAKAIQLMSGSIWDLTSTEIKNQMLIRVCGDITLIFDTFNWKTGRTSESGTTICVWTSKAFFRTHILKHSSITSRTRCIMLDSTSCRVHHLWRMT